jgi:deaminated glutathione amidase
MIKAAAIQMCSSDDLQSNLSKAQALIAKSAKNGAKLVVLPESFYFLGKNPQDKLQYQEEFGEGLIQELLSNTAKENNVWLVAGTIPIKSPDPQKPYASSLLFDNQGNCRLKYNKIHLFDVTISDTERYLESDSNMHGNSLNIIDNPFGKLAIVVCYDLRFLPMFEYLRRKNVAIICAPSAFTAITGKAHWELLVRSRALDTTSYIIAAAQGGKHVNGRETHGHSMIVNPWGEILAEAIEQDIIYADLDLKFQKDCKKKLAIHSNTRVFNKRLNTIVSGGQTGVDRAALDVAIKLGLEYGGWCPKGRLDEKGTIPRQYAALKEINGDFANDQENYNARTVQNIIDSDATLIVVPILPLPENIKDGTILTIEEITRQNKPYYILSLDNHDLSECVNWFKSHEIETINIAGPRESNAPGIYNKAADLLETVILSCINQLNFKK